MQENQSGFVCIFRETPGTRIYNLPPAGIRLRAAATHALIDPPEVLIASLIRL
jgi:hypothetical protein